MDSPLSPSSNSSSSLSNYLDRATPTSANFPSSISPTSATPVGGAIAQQPLPPVPTRSLSATTPTIRSPPSGGGSQTKRHSLRSPPPPLQHLPRHGSFTGNNNNNGINSSSGISSIPLDRTISLQSNNTTTTTITTTYQQRPTSPVTSPSIHKSLNALDAKSITRDMEKSTQYMRGDDTMISSPSSPTASSMNPSSFYFSASNNTNAASSSSGGPGPYSHHRHHPSTTSVAGGPPGHPYIRQGSVSSITVTSNAPSVVGGAASTAAGTGGAPTIPPLPISNPQGDVWQTLCVRVLPLFNGEGVKGNIEDLNELLRRCLSDPISPQLYSDIEGLLRDGMFTLNAKMLGVTDEKLLDRLVEQWSFFFTYALPYFEAVFLPLRTDMRYRTLDEAEMWNVRNMALRSFRDNVILLQTKRLEDVFAKLFTDFGSSQNPAATAAKMLQMTSLLASAPDHNEEIERVLSSLKANWKIMMTKGDRRGFAGVRKAGSGQSSETSNQIFGTLT
ncbi:HbrB-like-domain-containing protein [Zychaea mexicana]|uniref:HbrB-like-domain-containing protein n=1 Tax=Zychaea mexicana TaxID=64656 RepID=UPI0022FEA5DF|nr:HbrB-like-domain-containing protein [Zychaea mexicana]KAI9491406.1 HbrB-like-domain-containing protein [Zychaea mexicana]